MKKVLALLFCSSLLFSFTGCSDDDEGNSGSVNIHQSLRNITFWEGLFSKDIEFTTQDDWTVSINDVTDGDTASRSGTTPDWLTVSPMDGKSGDVDLRISMMDNNISDHDFIAEVVVTAKDGSKGTITVVQKPVGKGVRISKIGIEKSGVNEEYPLSYDKKGRLLSFGDKFSFKYEKVVSRSSVNDDFELIIEEKDGGTKSDMTMGEYDYKVVDGLAVSLSAFDEAVGGDAQAGDTPDMRINYRYNNIKQLEKVDFLDGGLSDMRITWNSGDVAVLKSDDKQLKLTYGLQQNDYVPLNLWALIVKMESDIYTFADFVNFRGVSSVRLPSRIEGERNLNFTYTEDEKGLLTQIDAQVEGDPESNYTIHITY